MKKFAVVEVGSTNTKSYLYDAAKQDGEQVTEFPQRTFDFKVNHKKQGHFAEYDINGLCDLLNELNDKVGQAGRVFVYGTSIFREISDTELAAFTDRLKNETGAIFSTVTAEQEAEYTVKGVTLGNDYCGRIAVMIGGGGSTEVCIVENKRIIEKHCNKYGGITVLNHCPQVIDYKPNLKMGEVDDLCYKMTARIKNKTDVLVLAGGDFKFFYECAGAEYLQDNAYYKDSSQPYMLNYKDMKAIDRRFVLRQDLADYYKNFPEYSKIWWNGARGMRFCVRAVGKRCGAKFFIPTKINMCLGIINELKNK